MSLLRSASIYILSGLLIIIGILAFAFRSQLAEYMSAHTFNGASFTDQPLKASAASVINLDILNKEQFKVLQNNIQYFDFNTVGKPGGNLAKPASWQPVYLGNSNPFLVPEKPDN